MLKVIMFGKDKKERVANIAVFLTKMALCIIYTAYKHSIKYEKFT